MQGNGFVGIEELQARVVALEEFVEVQRLSGMDKLCRALHGEAGVAATEKALQKYVRERLNRFAIDFREEARVSPTARFDFMHDNIAIELKIKGSTAALARQIDRYLKEQIEGVLVVTTSFRLTRLPVSLRDKPVRVVWVGTL